jgi:sugar-specific transcriptional regulator TrmB
MKSTHSELLQDLGLSPNEAAIFEALLQHGELAVADISRRAKTHRRNVYDALQRLLEKGLVYEILEHKHSLYRAVSPQKLLDLIDEKRTKLLNVMPHFMELFSDTPAKEAVLIYRGTEGLKNYMRDILRKGSDYYSIGAKGIWADPRVKDLLPSFISEAKKKQIKFRILYDPIVKASGTTVLSAIPSDHRFLPDHCKTPASLGVFGDTTVVLTDMSVGRMKDDISFTVITNKKLADSIRSWFSLLWEVSSSSAPKKAFVNSTRKIKKAANSKK